MRKAIRLFAILFSLIILTSCKIEKEAKVETIVLNECETISSILGEFEYENYSFTVTYDDGTSEVMKFSEDMLSSYDKLLIHKIGNHKVTVTIKNKSIDVDLNIYYKEFEGITFDPIETVYTGEPYVVSVGGVLPIGSVVVYPNGESFTEAGMYETTAMVSCEGYKTITLYSSILIKKGDYDLNSLVFENMEVTYDGLEHFLKYEGELPEGLESYYTITENPFISEEDKNENYAINAGLYYVTLHLKGDAKNYNTENLTITRTLTINKKDVEIDVSELSFDNKVVVYDGRPHSITIDEDKLPSGVSCYYENNTQTQSGEYEITVGFLPADSDNYKISKVLTAKLTILKATYEMTKIKLENSTIGYDGLPHGILITGNLPKGVEVDYYSYQKDIGHENGYVDAGEYEITVYFKINDNNHYDVDPLTAKLTIIKASFTSFDCAFTSNEIVYDGDKHEFKIDGSLPIGVSLYYTDSQGNYYDSENPSKAPKFSDVGTYTVYAHFNFNKENYYKYDEVPEKLVATFEITKRIFDSNHLLEVPDFECTYDGLIHGTLNEIVIPSWVNVTKYIITNRDTNEEVAIGSKTDAYNVGVDKSGNYSYYFTFEYFDGVEEKVGKSEVGVITIHKLKLSKTEGSFSYQEYKEVEYTGEEFSFEAVPADELPNKEEFYNNLSYVIKETTTNTIVDKMINCNRYVITMTFKNSENYTYTDDESGELKISATLVINRQVIDLSNVYPDTIATYIYDGVWHEPQVPNVPEHVSIICDLDKGNTGFVSATRYKQTYAVWYVAENSNYQLSGNQAYQCVVYYDQVNLKTDDINFVVVNNGAEYKTSESVYNKYNVVNEFGKSTKLDTEYANAYMQDLTIYPNSKMFIATLKGALLKDLFKDINIATATLVSLSEGSRKQIESVDLTDLESIELFFSNNGLFDKENGTPYGEYYIYIDMKPTTNLVRLEKEQMVLHVKVESLTFIAKDYFKEQTQPWKPNINSTERVYTYDISLCNLPDGVTIKNTSKLTATYDTLDSLYVEVDLNPSLYLKSAVNYSPVLKIEDITIDIGILNLPKKVTVTYNGLNHKNNWCNIDLFSNMSSEIKELYDNGYIALDITAEKDSSPVDIIEVSTTGYYGKVSFVSNSTHLTFVNSENKDKSPTLSTTVIVDTKLITQNDVNNAVENIVVRSEKGKIQTQINNYGSTLYYTNAAIGDRLNKTITVGSKEYSNVLEITSTNYYIGFNNFLQFTRGETNGNYNSPIAGFTFNSFEVYDENFNYLYTCDINNINDLRILSTSLDDTDPEYYQTILEKPVYTFYYKFIYDLDTKNIQLENQSFEIKTYDFVIKNTIISLYKENSNVKVDYDKQYHTIYIDNYDEIAKLDGISVKYKIDDGEQSSLIQKVSEPGTYNISLYVYMKQSGNRNDVLIGSLKDKITIKKIVVSDIGLDYYLEKQALYTGDPISLYAKPNNFDFRDHVYISKFEVSGIESASIPVKTDVGSYEVTITFAIEDGYQKYYEIEEGKETYKYTFNIVKDKIIANYRFHFLTSNDVLNITSTNYKTFLRDSDNLQVELYIENPKNYDIIVKLNSNPVTGNNGIYVIDQPTSPSKNINNSIDITYDDTNVEIGYYDGTGNFVALSNSLIYDVYQKLTNEYAKVEIDSKTETVSGYKVIYNGVTYDTLMIEVSLDYSDEGYSFFIKSTVEEFEVTTAYVNSIYLDDDTAFEISVTDGALTREKVLSADDLGVGEYYIVLMYNSIDKDKFISGTEKDTYIGFHLTITE